MTNIGQLQISSSNGSTGFPADFIGVQTLRISYKDGDEIYIHPGQVHINDGSDKFFKCTSKITKQIPTPAASTWYAVYVDPSNISTSIALLDIETSTTMPTLNEANRGYYHPTNTTWRCIGFVYSDGDEAIQPFYTSGKKFFWEGKYEIHGWAGVGTSSTQVVNFLPIGGITTIGLWMSDSNTTEGFLSTGGTTNDDYYRYSASRTIIPFEVKTDASKQIAIRSGGSLNMLVWQKGFYLPDEIYTN